MLNNVCLVGRLTRDPESSYTPTGVAVAKFTIACDRIYKDAQTGEKQTDFIPVVAWRKTAEFVTQYVGKGRLISLNGRIQVRSWVQQDGEKRFMTEIIAEEVQALDRPREDKQSDPREVDLEQPARPPAEKRKRTKATAIEPDNALDESDPFADE